jgi:translation elongation factor EF-4
MTADFRSGGSRKPLSWEEAMREYGSVSIPQEAFIAALRMGEE